jgi:3-hydroxyacyl-CoA dehydrogenase
MDADRMNAVAVIGLGRMGHGIAQTFAAAGCAVGCYDHHERQRQSLRDRVARNLRIAADAGLFDSSQIDATVARLRVCDTASEAMRGAEFVTEAIREDMESKQELFRLAEQVVSRETILATNTSSLRIGPMTAHLRHLDRVVVTHWFNPPHIVPVVEVVPGDQTSETTMDASVRLMRRIGKLAVRLTRDIPGFLVNRVQVAMIREVWSLYQQGVASAQDIDDAVRGSMGFRLAACGPLRVNDFGGLDIWKRVYENLAPDLESGSDVPPVIRERVAQGRTGIEALRGIYEYTPQSAADECAERDRRFLALAKLFYGNG